MAAKTDQWVRIFEVEETRRHTKGYTVYKVKSTNEENGSRHLLGHKARKNSKGRFKEAESLASTLGIQESSSLYSQLSDTEDDFSICSSPDFSPAGLPCPSASTTETLPAEASDKTGSSQRAVDTLTASTKGDHPGALGLIATVQNIGSHSYNCHENLTEKKSNITVEDIEREEKVKCDVRCDVSSENGVDDNGFTYSIGNCDDKNSKDILNQVERHASISSLSSLSSQPCCVYENPVHDSPKQHRDPRPSEDTQGTSAENIIDPTPARVKQTTCPVPPLEIKRRISTSSRKNSVPLTPLTPLSTTVTPVLPTHKVPSPQEVANTQYIFVAAQQINEAQHHEQNRDYKQALDMYREGVGTLLQGVQGDGDGSRREAVRRKTAQYLQRAEQLMARLTRKDKKKKQHSDGPPPEISSSGEAGLKSRASDLSRYRVAGLAGSVIIATDTTNGDTVAIKVLIKSGIGSGEKTVVPENVPFMVPIIRYHETDTAIYLVLKFISGGKLWSHIRKYVSEGHANTDDMFNNSSNTYAGRRLLQETTDPDCLACDALFLCETPSLSSHISSHLSSPQPCSQTAPSTNNFLTVPDCGSLGGSSGCSEASSSCFPNGYLQIFSDYTHSLPSSSSMVLIPPLGLGSHVATVPVPKSKSAGALVIAAECSNATRDALEDSRLSAKEDKNVLQVGILLNGNSLITDEDKVSIGSDTLSGVSEDFSCSMAVNIPNLLPDPLPLPEVKITNESNPEMNSDLISKEDESHFMKPKGDNNGEFLSQVNIRHCKTELVPQKHSEKCDASVRSSTTETEQPHIDKQGKTQLTRNGGREPLYLRATDNYLGIDDEKDDTSITDTSFASVTLPSFSWTKRDDSELASLDIEDLIRNSKQLLQNVDYTLQQSKSHGATTFHDSDDSTSVDHSELPYDGDSIDFDQPDKGKTMVSKMENEKKILQDQYFSHVSTIPESPSSANQSELSLVSQKIKATSLTAVKSDSLLMAPKCEVDHNERSTSTDCIEYQGVRSHIPIVNPGVESTHEIQDTMAHYEQQENDHVNNSLNSCEAPIESSLAALLEKYSANRGHDFRPRLPEGIVKVWSSQIISAITALHQLGVVWGDINSDNVLLDEGGSILVTYESRWSSVQRNVWSKKCWKHLGGQYKMEEAAAQQQKMGSLAPELRSPLAHPTTASDWWSVGAIMYHMLTGQSVNAAHPSGITSHTELLIPAHLSTEAASLLSQLLCAHPTGRLGGGGAGAQEIKDHAFFTGIEWTE
ncbi:ribosomal protein S6 kinase delta-1 isoform X2 [Procambarus clarkii]|uniref:ribosomal protein S6 kinase delta-1 isoform X2 n=1 Tax=Procambarus clarkii TaxID=6728 RepID=UPI00374284BD